MVEAQETSVWYRCYVLSVLFLLCVSNLATRNLPSYLITVPVPNCEAVCAGVSDRPLCGSHKWNYYPSDREPNRFEACQLCRARLVWVAGDEEEEGSDFRVIAEVSANKIQATQNQLVTAPKAHLHMRKKRRNASLLSLALENLSSASSRAIRPVISESFENFTNAENFSHDAEHAHAHNFQAVVEGGALDSMLNSSVAIRIRRAPNSVTHHHGTVVVKDASFYNMADGACLSHDEYGTLVGYGYAFLFAMASLPAGRICDRKPRVATASTALLAWSMATSMQASAHSFTFLLLCRCVVGLAQAFAMPAAISLTADYFKEKQTMAEVVLSVGLYLGSGCASFSILFAEALGWRWAVLLSGLAGIFLTALLYATVKEPERTEWSAPCALDVVAHEVYEKSRVAKMLIMAASAKMVSAYSLSAFLPIWYARKALNGYSNNEYALWNAMVISLGGMLSALIGSYCNHYLGQVDYRAPCWIGLVGSLLSLPLICIMLLTSYFAVSMAAFFVLILVGECWFGPSLALLQASVRRSVRGQAVSVALVAATMVGNMGPTILGYLDPGGDEIGFHLIWICLAANVFAAAAFAWTAQEINLDPVAAGVGDKSEWPYRCDYSDSARVTFVTIGHETLPMPPRGTSTPWALF